MQNHPQSTKLEFIREREREKKKAISKVKKRESERVYITFKNYKW